MTPDEIKSARALIANVMLQAGPDVLGSAAWFRDKATTLAKLLEVALGEVERLTLLSDAWRKILDAADYEARRVAICRTCSSNECQIRERCTSATACRSLYSLTVNSKGGQ